jgi:hypothetical protein
MKHIKDIKRKLEWEKYYNPYFDWYDLAFYADNTLSEDFIREFKDKVDWEFVSEYQDLSEDFIREFKDKVDWYWISFRQILSEDFIREFQDKVNWNMVLTYQKLSREFKNEYVINFKL